MVREIILLPDFSPGFVEVSGKIPRFQYKKSLSEELKEGSLTKEECIDLLKCMLGQLTSQLARRRFLQGQYQPSNQMTISQATTAGTEMP